MIPFNTFIVFIFSLTFPYGLVKQSLSLSVSKKCELSPLDLVFVVDMSGSIGYSNFYQSLLSLSRMVNESLQIGESVSKSHVGMVLFDENPDIYFYLNEFTSKGAVEVAINSAPYSGGGTNIYRGVKSAVEKVFGGPGDRKTDPNILLLITDGQDGYKQGLKNINIEATKKNITIFAIGVGRDFDYDELVAATGNASRVFNATNYLNMEIILKSFCTDVQHNYPPSNYGPFDSSCSKNIQNLWVDMVFVVDSSKGVDKQGLLGIGGAIAGFVSTGFTIGRNSGRYSRAGIVSMGTSGIILADLHKYQNSPDFIDAILSIPYNADEEPNIYDGLKKADQLLSRATGNPNRQQVVYLFSSKTNIKCDEPLKPSLDEDPCRLAAAMKEKGILIVTFALKYDGNRNVSLLSAIGSECFNFYNDEKIIEGMINGALYANCFCPQPLIQFKNDKECLKTAECIYVHEVPSTWSTAQMICPLDGTNSTLVNDFSIEKNEFLVEQLNSYNTYPYSIGLHDTDSNGNFKWDSNNDLGLYTNWDVNEPNYKNGNCVQINSKGKWFMTDCNDYNNAANYICEEPACDPDNFCP
uniref:VWFA domain-containing protein n=1 Tax=Strongyloides papillosus TaxID=174720 RepID=A0A0N5C974_STREA